MNYIFTICYNIATLNIGTNKKPHAANIFKKMSGHSSETLS